MEKTKVGYQYWFADKKFAEGKTLKLSVVQPKSATHAPMYTKKMNSFLFWKVAQSFTLMVRLPLADPMTSFYCSTGGKLGIRNIGEYRVKVLGN